MSKENGAVPRNVMEAETAALWCIRLSDGDMTAEEWEEFEIWLAQAGNGELLREASMIWQVSEVMGDQPEVIGLRSEALASFRKASARRWRVSWAVRWRQVAPIAAALLLAVSVALLWQANRAEEFVTGIGERRASVLADGSRVSLDAATRVEVRMKDQARRVELVAGRAKFDVAKDPLRPFTVAAGDKLIVAVGTSFSVELVDNEVRVILYEGRVEVRDRSDAVPGVHAASSHRITMVPGSELVDQIGSSAAPKVFRADLPQSSSWERGLIDFRGEALDSAIRAMGRYSAQPIRLANPALARIRVDGMFKAGDTDAFVEGVTAVHDLRVRRQGGEIIIEER